MSRNFIYVIVYSSEVQKAVSSVQELYRRWQDLLNNANSAGKEEFNWTTNEIKNSIRSVEWDLEDLEETIGIVESNPNKFTLSRNEIDSRKAFISNVKRNVQSIKDDINSSETKAKVEKSNRQVKYFYNHCHLELIYLECTFGVMCVHFCLRGLRIDWQMSVELELIITPVNCHPFNFVEMI